jgi:lysine decarboxylase
MANPADPAIDEAGLLADAPLLAAWLAGKEQPDTRFTIPGHKGRADRFGTVLADLLGDDIPLYGGLDTVKQTAGRLADAEARAAHLWGANWCRFSTGGSTHANQAVALSVGAPGDTVLVTRAVHRSTLLGIVLAGFTPVWLPIDIDPRFGIPVGNSPATVRSAIAGHPDARAMFLVEPNYLGTSSDLATLIGIGHDAGLPVIVDQAWAAHFGFHPALPPHALALGADALITSAHKTLPAYSQASLVLARTERLDPDRLERGFQAGNTTSPAGSILASIDAARALLRAGGPKLLGPAIDLVTWARQRLSAYGAAVPGPADFAAGRFDPLKLVVLLAGSGADGIAVEQDLLSERIPVEMADRDTVVPIVTLADTAGTVSRLVEALIAAIDRRRGPARPPRVAIQWSGSASAAMTPRAAFFARHETVPAAAAVGRVCAEVVAPYPPGVPVLIPGEVVSAEILDQLRAARAAGTRIAYAADGELHTVQVVA